MLSKIETIIQPRTKALRTWLRKWESQIALHLLRGEAQVTPEGLILFEDKRIRGDYFHRAPLRETEFTEDHNILTDQGIAKMLAVMFFTDVKIADWYIALVSGSSTPTGALTAANFASTMNEIVSTVEGYTEAKRQKFVTAAPSAGIVDNLASKATFTIAATTSITVTGAGLLSSDERGGIGGTCYSGGLFANARELYPAEPFEMGYKTSLVE